MNITKGKGSGRIVDLITGGSVVGMVEEAADKVVRRWLHKEENHSINHLRKALATRICKKARRLGVSEKDVVEKYIEQDLTKKYTDGEATYEELIEILGKLK